MKKLFIALTALCATFTACGDKTPSSSTSITVDGRIDVRNAVVVLPADSGQMVESELLDGSTIRVRQVQFDSQFDSILALYQYTDQMVAIDLSPIDGAITLQDVTQFFGQVVPNCKISNDKARIGAVILTAYNASGREIGDLTLTDLTTQRVTATSSFTMISQLYSTQNTAITGEWKEEGMTVELNLDLRKGWNDFVTTTSIDEQAQSAKITFFTTFVAKESLHWAIRPILP